MKTTEQSREDGKAQVKLTSSVGQRVQPRPSKSWLRFFRRDEKTPAK
jgi:hypothetical protein